ncbi:MAG: tyrosine-protein phosphatase [Novosphingobium sp.]|nr:tyrosine-protein phosphatase [Novosphingobium sp.]
MSRDRVLKLEGVHNFRDYGGYSVNGGGRLKRGLLWRSGQHHRATDADLAAISALNLASVFDLRSSHERTTEPCRRSEDFAAAIHLSDDPEQKRAAPHVAVAGEKRERTAESTHQGMVRNYARICFRPELQAMTRKMLAELAEGNGASLVNCMAGKDRTGIAVAMLHLAAGVHRDDVIEDYVLTNIAGDTEARIKAGLETIKAVSGTMSEEVLRVLMGVEPEYLESAFASIDEKHGSIDAYLAEALGADAALRERLRNTLIES